MTNITDNFNRADGGLGGSWTTATGLTAPEIASNVARATTTGAHCVAYWNANAFTDDQFAECTVTQLGPGGAFIGLTLRHQAGATNSFYVVYASQAGAIEFYKWTAGTPVSLGTAGAADFTSGTDVLRFEVSGSATVSLVAKKNGATVHTGTDTTSTFTAGSPGLNFFASVSIADTRADDWSAGPIVSAAADMVLGPIWT